MKIVKTCSMSSSRRFFRRNKFSINLFFFVGMNFRRKTVPKWRVCNHTIFSEDNKSEKMGDLIATLFEPYCDNGELDGDEVSKNTRNSDKLVDKVYCQN